MRGGGVMGNEENGLGEMREWEVREVRKEELGEMRGN